MVIEFQIPNWSKYNPRRDVKATSWFRLENNFWLDEALSSGDSDVKIVWLMLLSLASSKQSDVIRCDTEMLSRIVNVQHDKVIVCLEHLEAFEKIKKATSRPRHARVTSTSRPRHATDGTNGTNVTDNTNLPTNQIITARTRVDSPSPSAPEVGRLVGLKSKAKISNSKATATRLIDAALGGQISTLSDEDASALIGSYGTAAAFASAVSALIEKPGIESPRAYAVAAVARAIAGAKPRRSRSSPFLVPNARPVTELPSENVHANGGNDYDASD